MSRIRMPAWRRALLAPRSVVALAIFLFAAPLHAQQLQWLKQYGSSKSDIGQAVAPDGAGGAFFGGSTNGVLYGASLGQDDVWLERRDAAGNVLWGVQFGSSSSDALRAATGDGAGGVFVSGSTTGTLGGPNAGGQDAWVARYSAAGQQLWIAKLGSAQDDYVLATASDGAGGVYIGGGTAGALNGPSKGGHDAWLARYDGAGSMLWVRQYGSSTIENIRGMAADGAGGVVVTGTTAAALGGPHLGAEDVWLARYDANGTQVWRNQIGTSAADLAYAAAPDGAGGTFIGGFTYGALGGPIVGSVDAWVGRFDAAGAVLWLRQFGSNQVDQLSVLATDGAGGVYMGGETLGSYAGPYQGDGLTSEVWLAHRDAAGNATWSTQFGTFEYEYLFALAPDGAGGVFAGGMTEGHLAAPLMGLSDAFAARWTAGCPPAVTYCTPSGTSIPGCAATLSSSGAPTLSNPQGFTIRTTPVPAVNIGLCLFAANGPATIPFGTLGGVLCVQPPAFRSAPKLSGGGILPCDGQYTFTLQNLISASPIVTLGTTLHAQVWARDPANPDGFLLSNGITFEVCP